MCVRRVSGGGRRERRGRGEGSRAPVVGSSRKRTDGDVTSSTPTVTRRAWPPEMPRRVAPPIRVSATLVRSRSRITLSTAAWRGVGAGGGAGEVPPEKAAREPRCRLPHAAGLSATRQAEFGGVCEHLAHLQEGQEGRVREGSEKSPRRVGEGSGKGLGRAREGSRAVSVSKSASNCITYAETRLKYASRRFPLSSTSPIGAPSCEETHGPARRRRRLAQAAGDLAPFLPVGEHVEEGGLAAAGGPHDGRERPRREDARHAAQHVLLVPVQRPLALALWQRSLCARAGRCVELDGVVYVGEGEVDALDALGRLVRALEGRRARRRRLGEREAFCGGPGRRRRHAALRSRTREPDEGEPGVREEEDEADHDDRRDHLALEPRRPRILRLVDALVEAEVALRNINIGRNGDLDVAREVRGAGAKAGQRQPAVRRRRRVCHCGLHRVIER